MAGFKSESVAGLRRNSQARIVSGKYTTDSTPNQDQLGLTLILSLGRELGFSEIGLRDALAQRKFADKLNADFVGGVRSGVNGTPSFFINGVNHQGSYSFDELAAAIDARLHARAPRHRAVIARVRKKPRKLTTVMVARAAHPKLPSSPVGTTRQDDLSPALRGNGRRREWYHSCRITPCPAERRSLSLPMRSSCASILFLGPIDPQLGQLPAASLLKVIERKPAWR